MPCGPASPLKSAAIRRHRPSPPAWHAATTLPCTRRAKASRGGRSLALSGARTQRVPERCRDLTAPRPAATPRPQLASPTAVHPALVAPTQSLPIRCGAHVFSPAGLSFPGTRASCRRRQPNGPSPRCAARCPRPRRSRRSHHCCPDRRGCRRTAAPARPPQSLRRSRPHRRLRSRLRSPARPVDGMLARQSEQRRHEATVAVHSRPSWCLPPRSARSGSGSSAGRRR
mmetsp:Transcript_63778/g.207224  ORF Transcript_63778/g.207224 Transcript_63778/m.207224 type:complete len:228 (+) Transcript_63778:777-1460(+)